MLDVDRIRKDFPFTEREVNGTRVVFLDSAASSQKPTVVLDAMDSLYRTHYANVHRGVYSLSEESTTAYEGARRRIATFIGATSHRELIFVRNATEAINLVAHSWARANLQPGDAIVLTHMEHHANVVPWQILAAERDIEIRWVPLTPEFELDLTDLDTLLRDAKLFSFTAMSNVLGTINDVPALVAAGHAAGARVLVDACQSVPHLPTDVTAWGADFVAFSAHKMLGPTGIGGLWAPEALLDAMPPFMGGGDMISDVRVDGFVPNELPWKFEAGTPAFVEGVGWGAAVDYLDALGMANVRAHEQELTAYGIATLTDRLGDRIRIFGPTDPAKRGGAISFELESVHPHDVAQVLDEAAVCVRAGHHCAKPLMRLLGVSATARASSYIYNDEADFDALAAALVRAHDFFFGL